MHFVVLFEFTESKIVYVSYFGETLNQPTVCYFLKYLFKFVIVVFTYLTTYVRSISTIHPNTRDSTAMPKYPEAFAEGLESSAEVLVLMNADRLRLLMSRFSNTCVSPCLGGSMVEVCLADVYFLVVMLWLPVVHSVVTLFGLESFCVCEEFTAGSSLDLDAFFSLLMLLFVDLDCLLLQSFSSCLYCFSCALNCSFSVY